MKATLKRVQTRAMSDPKFFKALLADPKRALAENKMELAAPDFRRLREILSLDRQRVYVDLETMMRRARKVRVGRGLFWLGMWYLDLSMFPGVPVSKLPINTKFRPRLKKPL